MWIDDPQAVVDRFGSVGGIINCAGIIQPFVRLNDLEYAAIDRVVDVNCRGTLYMTKTFLPRLLTRPETHIVNVSSMGDGGEGAGLEAPAVGRPDARVILRV